MGVVNQSTETLKGRDALRFVALRHDANSYSGGHITRAEDEADTCGMDARDGGVLSQLVG